LIAEGERWRWQRQLLSLLFRAEEIAGYVPACAPVLARWNKADKGYSTDMAVTTLQVLEDTVLGVDLATEDHRRIAAAGTAHCVVRCQASLRLPAWSPIRAPRAWCVRTETCVTWRHAPLQCDERTAAKAAIYSEGW
jgi:cytochrome P450